MEDAGKANDPLPRPHLGNDFLNALAALKGRPTPRELTTPSGVESITCANLCRDVPRADFRCQLQPPDLGPGAVVVFGPGVVGSSPASRAARFSCSNHGIASSIVA